MARRSANGEGTIYRRKDGRWEGAIYVLTVAGVRKRERVYGQTRNEARHKLNELRSKQQQGTPIPDKRWQIGPYLDYWLERAVQTKRRPLTYRRHETVTRLYLKPGLSGFALDQLSVLIVQRFIDQLITTGHSSATVHQIRKVLSAALTYAVRLELLTRNVARLVELPSYQPDEAQHWTTDDTKQFLRAARSAPLYPLFVLLVLYGLRSGEVRGLRWRDIDFVQGVIHIRQQVQRFNGALRQAPLKTKSSRRDEPLLASVRDVLRDQQAKQMTERVAAGTTWQGADDDTELVFTTRSGRPIEARNVYRSFQRICTQHGIRRITLHGLRHTNATTQKSLKVHDRDIQAILGHGDVRTTGIYTHVDLGSKRAALEKVEDLLLDDEQEVRGRCRQISRHEQRAVVSDMPQGATKESIHLWRVDTFFGGSSQTRTGDTRLFSKKGDGVSERVASVREVTQRRTREHVLGVAAVNLAVMVPLDKDKDNPDTEDSLPFLGPRVNS